MPTNPDGTRILTDLYRHNQWANARVFGVCRGADAGLLTEAAPGTRSTIEETMKHLVGVEAVYLTMLQDQRLGSEAERDAFFAHDLDWFADQAAQLGEAYLGLIARLDEAALESPLRVPWFDFSLTKRDGLLQVLSHSAQHRAQVFSVLGGRRIPVPDLDYVVMVEEEQGG